MEKLPAQMTVVGISKPGGPEVLIPETRPVPTPGPGEILIRVAAAGVNRPDVAQRSGSYPPPPGASDLPGLEVAGEVVAAGPGATRHKLGDKVMSLVAGGGYAQYCIAQDAQAMAVPPTAHDAGSRRHSGNADDGLAQRVRARRIEGRRNAADPWRLVRHRHHGDPARESIRRQGDRHRRIEGKSRRMRQARRRPRHQLQDRGFRRRGQERDRWRRRQCHSRHGRRRLRRAQLRCRCSRRPRGADRSPRRRQGDHQRRPS